MNDHNERNGLFLEETEIPKRENPYLKKNRDKAKAGKQAEKRKTSDAESSYVAAEDKPTPESTPARENTDREVGYTHKRTFSDWVFENVKIIAAVATVLVVLSLVLITDVVGVVENLITQSQQADKEELTLTYVKGLSEKSSPITWGDLDRFRCDETKAQDSVTRMFSVKGTSYELWVSGVSTSRPPTYVYLYDMDTGDRLILGEEDFDTFIAEHSKK